MKEFLNKAATQYDLVILDSSPIMMLSDARILCRLADKTVFVVRWRKTRRDLALASLKQLLDEGCEVAGVVLSRVNKRKYDNYGYC